MKADDRGVRWTLRDGVAWITLDRPGHGNRIDLAAAQRLGEAAEEIEFDDRVAVVVLSGRGRDFCLGVEGGGAWEQQHDWVAAIGRLTRPVLAALNGNALAEGCELAMACDLRVAVASASLGLPQVAEGRLPRHGGTQRLPRLVGRVRAMDLLLSGRHLTARAACDIGLINRVLPRIGFQAAVRREAMALRARGPVALRLAKEAVAKGLDLTLEQGIRLEQDLYVLLQTTADRREGIEAFLGKRRPRFQGQ